MKSIIKYVLIVFVILLLISGIANVIQSSLEKTTEVSLSKLVEQINSSAVKEIVLQGDVLSITLSNGDKETSKKEAELEDEVKQFRHEL